jgi:hypothetical protein
MILVRLPDWDQRLVAFTRSVLRRPFEWGGHDCALFAADAVAAMTGFDLAADYRGQYASEEEAWEFLASLGYFDLEALAAARLPRRSIAEARRGDVALAAGEFGDFLAICDGETMVGPSARGVSHTPMTSAKAAFGVG